MGNSLAKRKKRSSQAIRPIFTTKFDNQVGPEDDTGDYFNCNPPKVQSAEFCYTNGYASDTISNAKRNWSCCPRSCADMATKQPPMRIFSFQTCDLQSRYCLGMELRRGRSGVVRVCIDKKTGDRLACKTIDKSFVGSGAGAERIKREAEIMARIAGHPNIIELRSICEDNKNVYLVMELASGGDLSDCIIARNHPFPEPLAAKMFMQIARAVQFIHLKGIVHRDLKPENILVVKSNGQGSSSAQGMPFKLKLADFGMAVRLSKGKRLKGIRGTKVFLAPEMLCKDKDYGFEVDIWSLGVLLYVLLFKEIPFNGNTDEELFRKIKSGNLSFKSHNSWNASDLAKDLIRKMLVVDPRSRLTIDQVLSSPWLRKHCKPEEF